MAACDLSMLYSLIALVDSVCTIPASGSRAGISSFQYHNTRACLCRFTLRQQMMGNGRAGKASANDHDIGGGWQLLSAAVAVRFAVKLPKGRERGRGGRWCERHCCCCAVDWTTTCLLPHSFPSKHHLDRRNISLLPTCVPVALSRRRP
jgi:hypothetical protein